MSSEVDAVIAAVNSGKWSTADLVRLANAVGAFGKNGTSVLGQYGEELVAQAFGGTVAGFDTKAYDVRTPQDGDLQVKTFSVGKRPGEVVQVFVELEVAVPRLTSALR